MKKITLLAIIVSTLSLTGYAGGLLTNANQSAQYVRMLSRNASTQIDAVYFNPAGLIKLNDGWHFALHNQSIFQTKTVESYFPLLNDGKYEGKVEAPVFPSAFAVYKKENWAFSLGFGPNGGGGSADFDRGLPSFEIPISKVVPGLAGLSALGYNVTGYNADLSFEGSSVFWGIQAGATYKVSDMVSVYGGVRYLPSTNAYTGSIKDISLQVGGQTQNAKTFLTGASATVKTLANGATAAASSLQPLVVGGAGSYTLAQVQGQGYISAAQKAQLEAGLQGLGLSPAQIAAITVEQAQGVFTSGAFSLNTTSATLAGTATMLDNKEVDTKQTGAGWTPILGANFSPAENLNITVKYEFETKLTLTNETKVDDLGLFPNNEKSQSDLPAILTFGAGYKPLAWLETQLSYNLYFDKGVNWGKNVRDLAVWKNVDPTKIRQREIDHNYWELALGLQFNLSDRFALSVGGLRSAAGIAESYQSDFSYSNPSYTGALGFQWKINDQLTFDAGLMNSFYEDKEVPYTDPDVGNYKDKLSKKTSGVAFGLSYSIFK